MSGTSLDGIDVALLRTDGEEQVSRGPAATYPYRPGQQAVLRDALQEAKALTSREARPGILAEAERALTEWHAEAVSRFLDTYGLTPAEIDVIGFHGQTVIHRPERRLTVQLGLGPALARRIGIPVVHDMRAADVAAGGQGAPLVPVYHRALAAAVGERPLAFVNIGGVANMTWIGRNGDLVAFDTGPGNALLNDWCERWTDVPYDVDGCLSASGKSNRNVIEQQLKNNFFATSAPKSLDRNSFDVKLVEGLSPADGAATLARFTAEAIAASVKLVPEPPRLFIVCGGGRLNPTLMRDLRECLQTPVMIAEEAGMNGDSMEAEAWAYLAVRCLGGLAMTFPGTTGVPEPLSGGLVARP
ncbi:anhydro-N-acetylmuramic acid kinase [Aestuariivirga sp.]|uniref:anhydro-N-acetylmuramic acid kinase n=1 Tax=Aestuariivirga sp. TaxID=2650926 RepID=UPI0025B7BB18|nr:anhydro-N-acetylmuramic acid kinase [Aestuariivirga sp.]